MDQYSALISTVLVALLLMTPIVMLFAIYRWWRSARALRQTKARLEERTASATRIAEAAKVVVEAKKALDQRLSYLESRFAGVIDLDDEAQQLRRQIEEISAQHANLGVSYSEKKLIFDKLVSEIAIFDERLAFAEMGVYEPHFDFSDSEAYKAAITSTRDKQKALISKDIAVICTTNWTVNGNESQGQMMIKRNIRLTLRAFNNECDAAIANARWNNVNAMEKRIVRAQEQIDKLNISNAIFITPNFVKLKLEELFLTHEYREKLKAERDERAEAARQAREEQKFIRDMEAAEEEEDRYARLLAKAQAEAARASGPQLQILTEQVRALEHDLAEAHAKFERAQSMAEKTRSGYVYIISNIGSFGEGVIKIGLTRRLDPMDRVRELGDASVPFTFDVHAVIYSDNAPSVERALHGEFEATRINTQNYRKEFFRASLDEVETAVRRVAPGAPFFKDIEAQEYRETLARRREVLTGIDSVALFPSAI
jgi:hypothetical protein